MPASVTFPEGVVEGPDGRRRCWWPGERSALRRLSRRGMGTPGHGRQPAFREALPGGISVRPLVADHPAQAREFPRGLCRLRFREGREIRRARREALPRRRRHRAPPRKDRIGHQQRQARAGAGRRGRARSPRSSGATSPIRSRGRSGSGAATSFRHRRNRSRSRRICGGAAGRSSGRRRSTPSCRPWGWSTTTSTAAPAATKPRPSGAPSCGQNSGREMERPTPIRVVSAMESCWPMTRSERCLHGVE